MAKDEIKQKIVSLTGTLKTKEVGGERRIVFVASSDKQDRHYEHVNVESLRLPLKDGGEITASAIPAEGVHDIVDVPLMLNHSADVRDVIGSVRAAYFVDNELIFECGISQRDIAQEMLVLLDEGHLSNAFSITMIDFDYNFESESISNAEVIEVSLVYRGSNKESRLLAIKSLIGGNEMSDVKEKQNDTFGDANGDGKDHSHVETPAETSKEDKPEKAKKEVEEAEVVETPVETTEEETEQEPAEEKVAEVKEEKEMSKEIAKDVVAEKAAQPVQTQKSVDYLSTKAAMKDFKDVVLKNHRGNNDQIIKEWSGMLKDKAITGDAILPSRIENIFFKAWEDVTNTTAFRTLGVKAGSVYAMTTGDTAKAHAKGATKTDQTITSVRRDLKAICMYKKLPIDLQDLFDDETGELLAFRAEELAARVANQIVVTALIGGEGAQADNGGRGLYPVATDIADTTGFGKYVATEVAGVAGDTNYEIAVKTLGAVKGQGKTLFVPTGFKTELLLAKTDDGGILFPVGTNLDTVFDATIVEMDELAGADYKAIAIANGGYVINGEANASVRTDFDLTNNTDVMLVERYVGGSLAGNKVAAGYKAA